MVKVNLITKLDIQKAVKLRKEQVSVCSTVIAKIFGKRHDHILAKVREEVNFLTTKNLGVRNYFQDNTYINSRGKVCPRFNLTQQGFHIIVLSMNGDKAKMYKYWFVEEFHNKRKELIALKVAIATNKSNPMWNEIREETKTAREILTSAIQEYELPQRIKEKKNTDTFMQNRISTYTKLIYKALDIKGVKKDSLTLRQLIKLEDLEIEVAELIKELIQGNHYKIVYQKIKARLL